MNRRFRMFAIALIVGMLAGAGACRAVARGPVSPHNPYRSFNISGVNYGSMQWERQHRSRAASAVRHQRGRWFGWRR